MFAYYIIKDAFAKRVTYKLIFETISDRGKR